MASSLHARHHPPNGSSQYPALGPTSAPNNYSQGPGQNDPRKPPNHGPVPPGISKSQEPHLADAPKQEKNIMNIRGDMTSSLYQICLSLRRRLAHVPGFHQYLAEMEEDEAEAEGATDPVTSMWNCLRRGYPLMTIYNAFRPHNPLIVDANRVAERQIGKAATFKFLQACLTDLMIPANECFLITDLYGGDTTGFVKVTKVVNKVLDKLDERGLLLPSDPRFQDHDERSGLGSKLTQNQRIVQEIVESERTYVQHLEVLQQVKNEIEAGGIVPGDSIHDIFLNLNALLDFQRRFLIRIEQQNSLPESQQNWGQLFIQYRDSFRVYEPFIANQTRCNRTVTQQWEKLNATPHSKNINEVFESQAIFHSFIVKPFQRLSKYPLLLKEMRKDCDLDGEREADLDEGIAAAESLMQRANEAVAQEEQKTSVAELQVRVEDWKGHDMKHFGALLLHGNYTVIKGEGAKPAEREVGIIFDTFTLQMRSCIRSACRQDNVIMSAQSFTPSPHASGVANDAKFPCSTEDEVQPAGRSMRKLSSSRRLPFFSRSSNSNSHESSSKGTYWSSLLSPKSPVIGKKFFRVGKTPKRQRLRYVDLHPHIFFNGCVKASTNFLHTNSNTSRHYSKIFSPSSLESEYINEQQFVNPSSEQYIIYLFERILLCCKEINPNKQRAKMLSKERAQVTLGKPRLQLKGRIFMQNVTDVMSFCKIERASYTIQIYWRGDPGVEHFTIRFSSESEMNKWRDQVLRQQLTLAEPGKSSGQTGTSETVLTSMRNRTPAENPYLQNEDAEDEEDTVQPLTNSMSEFAMSRNASSNSLRTTAAQPPSMMGRGPPSRFPFSEHGVGMQPPLSLNTNLPTADSPGDFPGNSYFSPGADSPSSTRSSSQAPLYPLPRGGTPVNHWSHEDSKHRTAPAASGPLSRDGSGPLNAYQINGRTVTRPSLPVMPANQASQVAQQLAATQSRMRSASTPNIHDPAAAHANGQGARRYANGQVQPTIDNVPVPPLPSHMAPSSHMAQMRNPLNRSQTSSPTNGLPTTRNTTQSPLHPRERVGQHPEQYNQSQMASQRQQVDQRSHMPSGYSPAPITVLSSPPLPTHTTSESDIPYPSQLKVKIWFEPAPSHVTIVVPIVIKHRSLIDRIDSKMVKISSASISKGTARLKYRDRDDDYITIGSDEDVGWAIEDWGMAHEDTLRNGIVSDFELHWEEK
ncbi:MAG: hypothetical protein Q9220_004739 [cf. Caloplaca sp. 1 TL-2023]